MSDNAKGHHAAPTTHQPVKAREQFSFLIVVIFIALFLGGLVYFFGGQKLKAQLFTGITQTFNSLKIAPPK